MKIFKAILLTLVLLIATQCSLQVYMPTCAVNEINVPMNYTLANFGHILYGRTVIGQLMIPANQQFCNSDNNETFSNMTWGDVKKFVLIKRGNCKFTKKILNAQKKGADMVIIYDNEKTATPNVIMSNDGHGHLINIPSIFISNSDGQKLLKTYQKCSKSLMMEIYFNVYTSKIANLTFWLDINNRESFITLRDFYRDYHKIIQKYINYDIKFKINRNCGKEQCETDDCIKDKKQYCLTSNEIIEGVPVLGKQLINEELRSYFLFEAMKEKKTIDKWFEYMAAFDYNLCMEKLDLKQCSLNILKQYIKPEQIEAKIVETYSNVNQGKDNVLTNFTDEAYRSDILFYPEVSINGRNFYGLFRAPDIFEMTCQSLEKPPTECYSFMKNDRKQTFGQDQSKGLWKTVLLIIIVMLILFFAALCIYNRLIRQQMNQKMSVEVNKMVEHYVAMTEQKSRSHTSMA